MEWGLLSAIGLFQFLYFATTPRFRALFKGSGALAVGARVGRPRFGGKTIIGPPTLLKNRQSDIAWWRLLVEPIRRSPSWLPLRSPRYHVSEITGAFVNPVRQLVVLF